MDVLDVVKLSEHLQALRRHRGLTLADLATVAEVSVSMLSAVERGEKVPTVLVLSRIADGLGVSLAELVADAEKVRVVVRRAAEHEHVEEIDGWQRTILSPVVPGVNFEWIRTTLPAGCNAGRFPAYAPGSHEFVFVQDGTLRLTIEDRDIDLLAGDSVYFAADASHGYANPTSQVCVYYVAALIMRSRVARTASESGGQTDSPSNLQQGRTRRPAGASLIHGS